MKPRVNQKRQGPTASPFRRIGSTVAKIFLGAAIAGGGVAVVKNLANQKARGPQSAKPVSAQAASRTNIPPHNRAIGATNYSINAEVATAVLNATSKSRFSTNGMYSMRGVFNAYKLNPARLNPKQVALFNSVDGVARYLGRKPERIFDLIEQKLRDHKVRSVGQLDSIIGDAIVKSERVEERVVLFWAQNLPVAEKGELIKLIQVPGSRRMLIGN